jgi:cytochrome c
MSKRITPLLLAAVGVLVARVALADDTSAGEAVFKHSCAICHATEAGRNKVGPSLFGVVGRKSGSVEGFNYSPAMKSANVTWAPDTLDKYLADPKAFIPGDRMAFPGLKKEDERKAVIAYLASLK